MAISVCKDCTERTVGCHATCKAYIEERKAFQERKEVVNKNRRASGAIASYFKTQIRESRKRG